MWGAHGNNKTPLLCGGRELYFGPLGALIETMAWFQHLGLWLVTRSRELFRHNFTKSEIIN